MQWKGSLDVKCSSWKCRCQLRTFVFKRANSCNHLPRGCSKGSGQSGDQSQQESVWVLPCNHKVNEREDEETMDGMANDATGDVLPQAGKQQANILHFYNLSSNQEHNTQWCVPLKEKKWKGSKETNT